MIDEREIIRKLRQGEDDAFRSIYFEYYGMLYHLGQRYLSDSVETKEILQRVFLKLWEIRGQLKEGSNVRNYLFTLVKNSC
jgi:RNA polymerase sigma-70 factor (ECF subfamily)